MPLTVLEQNRDVGGVHGARDVAEVDLELPWPGLGIDAGRRQALCPAGGVNLAQQGVEFVECRQGEDLGPRSRSGQVRRRTRAAIRRARRRQQVELVLERDDRPEPGRRQPGQDALEDVPWIAMEWAAVLFQHGHQHLRPWTARPWHRDQPAIDGGERPVRIADRHDEATRLHVAAFGVEGA